MNCVSSSHNISTNRSIKRLYISPYVSESFNIIKVCTFFAQTPNSITKTQSEKLISIHLIAVPQKNPCDECSTHKQISTTINCPLNACFDLNPQSGTQLCLKAAIVSFSSNHTEHQSLLPPILKQITSTLTTINNAGEQRMGWKYKTSPWP